MLKLKGLAAFLFVTILAPALAYCSAPNVTLIARLVAGGSGLSLTFMPSSNAAGCAYSLLTSEDPADFEPNGSGGVAIATFPAEASTLKRVIKDLKLVSRKNAAKPKAYFRAKLVCAADSTLSNVASLKLKSTSAPSKPGTSGSTSVSRWLQRVGADLNKVRVTTKQVFSELSFRYPIAFASANDGSKRLFVAEQGGKIFSFENRDTVEKKQLFLDLSERISFGGELGLLALVFHPQFAQNGKFYVYYTEPRSDNPTINRSVIAGFTVHPLKSNVADAASEIRYIVFDQPYDTHKGGNLAFGPDGYLYISFGDGGSPADSLGAGQDRTTLLGKILRIDVDTVEGAQNYGIPSNNPFKGNSSGFREEIYAYGFRNVFRFSFDFPSSRLFAGDVGQSSREEIDLVEAGENYGWNTMEGSQCFPPGTSCSSSGLTLPIHEYDHSVGKTVIGGYVYHGKAIPSLQGYYVFGDFVAGSVFALRYDGIEAVRRKLASTGSLISSFGVDERGELYVLSYGDGHILKIVPKTD